MPPPLRLGLAPGRYVDQRVTYPVPFLFEQLLGVAWGEVPQKRLPMPTCCFGCLQRWQAAVLLDWPPRPWRRFVRHLGPRLLSRAAVDWFAGRY